MRTGDVHKKQRKIVAPVFSVPQLKKVTPIVYEIAEKVRRFGLSGRSSAAVNNW